MTTRRSTNLRNGRPLDLGLRALGIALLVCCILSAKVLLGIRPPPADDMPTAAAFLLATVSFLSFSAGAGLVALGRHIFDEVSISTKWSQGAAQGRDPDGGAELWAADAEAIDQRLSYEITHKSNGLLRDHVPEAAWSAGATMGQRSDRQGSAGHALERAEVRR